MIAENIEVKIVPVFQFETNGELILNFLKEHYQVPNGVTGFTLTADVNDVLRIEWRTILVKNNDIY